MLVCGAIGIEARMSDRVATALFLFRQSTDWVARAVVTHYSGDIFP